MRRVEVNPSASPPHPAIDAVTWVRWEARAQKATREVRDWIDAVTVPPLPVPVAGAAIKTPPTTPPELRDSIWGDLKDIILNAVFHGRCAFCELDETVGGFGDGEHYRPKRGVDGRDPNKVKFRPFEAAGAKYAGYIWLAYDWLNLVPACSKCNTYKANHFWVQSTHCLAPAKGSETTPELNACEKPLLLHPYFDDPREHLTFGDAGEISARGQSARGEATIEICKLDRPELKNARHRAQDYAWSRVRHDLHTKSVAEAFAPLFARCDAGEEPFSAAVSEYLARRLGELVEESRKSLANSEALLKKRAPDG